MRMLALLVLLAGSVLPAGAAAEPWGPPSGTLELEVRVWMDRGHEPVLSRGERTRLYYHVSDDAHVAIFHVDTNGVVRLVHPGSPDESDRVRGGRDFRLLFPHSSYWYVEDDPGIGYFFAVASPEPLDFSRLRYSRLEGGWDLARVGRQVYRDPYAAMDDYVAYLIPDWEYVPYALDFTSYHVGGTHDYPRFLCYDCHGFRPYSAWNPYLSACVNFRVVVYDDPYYYPVSRYRGTQVVYVRPPAPGQPRFTFKERVSGEASAPLVRRRDSAAFPPAERRVAPGAGDPTGPLRRNAPATVESLRSGARDAPPAAEPARAPNDREMPTLQRRVPPGSTPSGGVRPSGTERDEPAGRGQPTRNDPPPARGQPVRNEPPPARGQVTPTGRVAPPAQSGPPPARGNPPPAENRPAPSAGSRPAPAAQGGQPARNAPPPARSSPPPARSNPPPARNDPPPARSDPPPAQGRPPAPARSDPPPSRSPA